MPLPTTPDHDVPLARLASCIAVTTALWLGGCSSDPGDADDQQGTAVQLGAPGETNRVLRADELDTDGGPAYTDADVTFVQDMIHHHRQALTMTALVADRSDSDDLALVAERMDVSQRDEIGRLEGWLTGRDEALPTADDHGGSHQSMPGMLSDAELAQLEAANGPEFDRLFLQYMIRHHEGAIVMVETLLSGAGGQEPEIFQLAGHIESDQAIEISAMKRLLTDL